MQRPAFEEDHAHSGDVSRAVEEPGDFDADVHLSDAVAETIISLDPKGKGRENVRHARIVNRPAALERPNHPSIHKPPHDMPLRAIHRVPASRIIQPQPGTLKRCKVVVAHALPCRNDEVRSKRSNNVERLHPSVYLTSLVRIVSYSSEDDQKVVERHASQPDLREAKIQAQADEARTDGELGP